MYINEVAHTKEQLQIIREIEDFCKETGIELDYGMHYKNGNLYQGKRYNRFQNGADLIYQGHKIGRLSFRALPKGGHKCLFAVTELKVNSDIDDWSAKVELDEVEGYTCKDIDEFEDILLENKRVVDSFTEMLKKIKKFVEIISI